MAILKLFNSKSSPAAEIPLGLLDDALWQKPNAFTQDNSFTDHLFLTLGIGRLNHFGAKTVKFMTNPGQTFMLAKTHRLAEPMGLSGSPGIFICTYPMRERHGVAVLMRDAIPTLDHLHKSHHLLLAFAGVADPKSETFGLKTLISGTFGEKDKLTGRETVPVTVENAYITMDYTKWTLAQMLAGKQPTPAANLRRAQAIDRSKGPELLDKPDLTP